MRNILKNTEASVVKDVLTMLEDDLKSISSKIVYEELDARKEISEGSLPNSDLIGVTQFAISQVEGKIWEIHFMVAVSTISDPNLFRLRELANVIYDRYSTEGAQITYYDADTALKKSWIYVLPEVAILPTHRVETRPFRFIQVQALLDPLQGSEPPPQSPFP
jgi:hypothetical protein